jgi:hypothetical protein
MHKKILITDDATLPEGLDPEEYVVVSPDSLDDATKAALEALAGGGEDAGDDLPTLGAPDDGEPAEADETLSDELAETPDEQATEEAEGTEQHGGAEVQKMVEAEMDRARAMKITADKIAESMPDAEDDASEISDLLDELEDLYTAVMDADEEDPEAVREAATEFEAKVEEIEALCAKVKAYIPAIAEVPAATGLGAWAKRTATG